VLPFLGAPRAGELNPPRPRTTGDAETLAEMGSKDMKCNDQGGARREPAG